MTNDEIVTRLRDEFEDTYTIMQGLRFVYVASCLFEGREPTDWQPNPDDTIAWINAERDGVLSAGTEPTPNAKAYEEQAHG